MPNPALLDCGRRPTTILLARHGQSFFNAEKRISGQFDTPLSPKGVCQAHLLAQVLRYERLSAVYSSTLSRAVETARPTATGHGLQIQPCDALKEIRHGVLEGRFRDARDPEAQRLWEARKKDKLRYRAPGGESFIDLACRVAPCLNAIIAREAGNVVLLVGHQNTNRAILGALLNWPLDVALNVKMRGGELYEILTGEMPRFSIRAVGEALTADRRGDRL